MNKLFNKVKDMMFGEFNNEGYDDNNGGEYYEEDNNYEEEKDNSYDAIKETPRNREAEYDLPVNNNNRRNQQQPQQPQQRQVGQIHNLHPHLQNESGIKMIIAKPEKYEDSQGICDQIKQDIPVIVNLEKVEYPVAQRIMDFLSGTSYALDGNVQRVASNIFLFAPEHIDISIDFKSDGKNKNSAVHNWVGNNR